MGVPICLSDSQSQEKDSDNTCLFCCKKNSKFVNEEYTISNQLNLNNSIKYNLINNKNISPIDNLSTTEDKNNNQMKYNISNIEKFNDFIALNIDHKNLSRSFSMYNEGKNIQRIIRIQTYFKKYLKGKNKKKVELNLKFNIQLSDSFLNTLNNDSNNNNQKSSINLSINNSSNNSSFENNQFSFNIKKKKNINYKYSGYIKIKENNNTKKLEQIKEGFGKMIFEDGSEFWGIFKDNDLQKYGKYINVGKKNNKSFNDENSIILDNHLNYEEFLGEYKDFSPNGFGIYKNFLTNLNIQGIFRANTFSGIGIEESGEGGYTYTGEFLFNKKKGYGTMLWKDGQKYTGEFNNNQMNGYGIIKYPENIFYQGEIKNGRLEGFGEFFWKKNKKYIGNYKNDKRNGFGTFIFKGDEKINPDKLKPEISRSENTILSELSAYIGFWKEGKMDGLGIKINCKDIKFGIWKDGKKEKWLKNESEIKDYFTSNNCKKYNNFFLSQKSKIYGYLEKCMDIDEDIFPFDETIKRIMEDMNNSNE